MIDCEFGSIPEPADLAAALSQCPGVVEHGLFIDRASAVYVGAEDDVSVSTY